jgi:hypothetical protein
MIKHLFGLFASGAVVTSQVLPLYGTIPASPTVTPTQDNVRYVGSVTCQSSMCHGGASPMRDQFTIWSHEDFHSRAYATLVTARSVQIAQSLGITDATSSNRCTTCHAPLADIPPSHVASTALVTDGVSCEACHSGAAAWLRGHTRPDWTYADRVHAGMRDLRSAFVRANTCVACHQVIDPALIKAGHPELIFELDGQTASEPRHWTEKADWFGPKAWLVGQAVALREISLQLSRGVTDDGQLLAQQQALLWLLRPLSLEGGDKFSVPASPNDAAAWGNYLGSVYSALNWNQEMSSNMLSILDSRAGSFTDNTVPLAERELRAERLVLGLDRLFKSLHKEPDAPGQAELAALFDAVQDRNQFNPQTFSSLLQKFADVVTPKK